MTTMTILAPYSDDKSNKIICESATQTGVTVKFLGSNNQLFIESGASISNTTIHFDCDNGRVEIGKSGKGQSISVYIRVGQDSTVTIGDDVSTTSLCVISAVEGATVSIGNDVMIASLNEIRADDAHPIFDVETGRRVNSSKDILIGNHVWLARSAVGLGGARVGAGSVIGFRSIVTGRIPNNCVAVGSPARVVRRNIAWERPHLSMAKPFYKPDSSSVQKSAEYWSLTEKPAQVLSVTNRFKLSIQRRAWHARRRLLNK